MALQKQNNHAIAALDILLFILLGIIWGGSFVAIKILVTDLPPWYCSAIRMVFALLTMLVIYKIQGRKISLAKADYIPVWIAGMFTIGFPFAFLFWGEQKISAGLGGMLNGTTPIWAAIILMAFPLSTAKKSTHDSRKKAYLGIILGFLGIVFIFAPRVDWSAQGREEMLGALGVLAMAFCYGLSAYLNRKILVRDKTKNHLDIRSVAFHQTAISFVFLILLSAAFEPWPAMSIFSEPKILWSFIYLGSIASAVAFLIHFHLIREIGALKTSAVTYIIPISALFFDALFFKNIPEWSSLIGITFVFLGLFFIRSDPSAV